MWGLATAAYWGSAAVLGHAYVGYPAVMQLLARLRRPHDGGSGGPSVSVVMVVHNEQARIEDKLHNLLACDYPADKLEVIVVSDGSSDGTDERIAAVDDPRLVHIHYPTPSGKPNGLNLGVARAKGEVIVFCDVRQRLDHAAIRQLARHFDDESIGAVSGALHLDGAEGTGMYWRYERALREAEARFDSVVGVTGALYAARRALVPTLPKETLLDDVFIPMRIAMEGYRILFEREAKAFDAETNGAAEFARKARTMAGNFQLLDLLPDLTSPRKNRLWAQFMSHKVARLACPVALVVLLGSNLYLVVTLAPGWPLYAATLTAQAWCYGTAGLAIARKRPPEGRLGRLAHTFVMLNSAVVEGYRRYRRQDFSWTSAKRPKTAPQAEPKAA